VSAPSAAASLPSPAASAGGEDSADASIDAGAPGESHETLASIGTDAARARTGP
jgi:hypothetical protein